MCSAARRRRLVNSSFSLIELFFSPERLYREHRDAFELPEEIFWKQYRLPKIVVRWLCDELREEPEVRRVRTSWTVMTVELQVLCALRFYGTGSFQGMVASDEHVARDQKTVSVAVRAVSVAIVRRLGVQRGWIHFPETPSERFDAEKGFRLLGRIPGVIGCVDGTMVSIVGPSKNDPTVTKAAYWCRKYFYALNVMVVCDADCRIMCIDPRYPGSVHDSFVWQFSWLRNQLEQGQVPRDGRFLLGDSGYPLEPWLITPVPGNHATSTACGRFNKAHSSIRSVVERCIGLLKNRFRCLQRHRALYYHPSTATAIISACAVLHNICLASREPEPESDSDPEESELESEPSSDGSEPSSERSASAPERMAPAGPPVGLPVGLSDRGKALRQRLVARFGTRRRRARAVRHTQGVRRHDGSPDHQGHRREAPQRPRCGGAQHGRRQRQGTSRHHD
ncbi:putative nuclease HARBI1 isoform X1 [Ixodes scapularis]